jgi:hypothetical protein
MQHDNNHKNPYEKTAATPERTAAEDEFESAQGEPPKGFSRLTKAVADVLNNARGQKPVVNRRDLGVDKGKTLLMLAVLAVALILVFFGLFSHSPKKPGEANSNRGQANLGRKVTPGTEHNDAAKSAVPLLDARVQGPGNANTGEITSDDINRTSRDIPRYNPQPAPVSPLLKGAGGSDKKLYEIKDISFGDENGNKLPPPPPLPGNVNKDRDLKKGSIVYVSAAQNTSSIRPLVAPEPVESTDLMGAMPPGTKLMARLQAPVSSGVSVPVIAIVEYNYEHNGTIILPAGSKVVGHLAQATASGIVNLQFNRIEMPDGTTEKIDASAMDLSYGPLKGNVTGKKRGTRFLVSSLTGLGTVASYLVGGHGSSGFEGPISENTLVRERIADNIGQAGQQELNTLVLNQSIVVTVPGNTRFYVVLQKSTREQQKPGAAPSVDGRPSSASVAGSSSMPTMEELRQLLELRKEINQLYQQTNAPAQNQGQEQ